MWKANHIELITFLIVFQTFFLEKLFHQKMNTIYELYFLFLELSNFLGEVICSEKARIAKLYTYNINRSIVINIFIDYIFSLSQQSVNSWWLLIFLICSVPL